MANIILPGVASDRGLPCIVREQIPMGDIALNPTRGYGFFDDFVLGAAHATTGTTLPGWIVSEITDGQIQPGDEVGGSIVFVTPATDNNGIQAQTSEFVMPDVLYKIAFGARIKVVDADQQDVFIGLCTADTDVAQTVPNDAIGFKITDQSANLLYYCQKDGTGATGTDTGVDVVDATYFTVAALVTEEKKVQFYVDNSLVATYETVANIPDDEALAFVIANVAGEGTANSLTIDWAYCFQWVI